MDLNSAVLAAPLKGIYPERSVRHNHNEAMIFVIADTFGIF
jgi:hypothetical protein